MDLSTEDATTLATAATNGGFATSSSDIQSFNSLSSTKQKQILQAIAAQIRTLGG